MALEEKLKRIFNKFDHKGQFESFKELASGHINDTYFINTQGNAPNYVLQRINNGVFKDVPGLINNKTRVSEHLQEKLLGLPPSERKEKVLTFLRTLDDKQYYQDEEQAFWNVMLFIENSMTYEKVKKESIAYEAGKLIGDFLGMTNDFDVSKLIEVIPNFHKMSFRYQQFYDALKNASEDRKEKAKEYIDYVVSSKEEMHQLEKLADAGDIQTQVTHNDTKISNVLFDKKNHGICVIDTDTVMPGIVHYDFGDAIRTICNNASEDETDLSKVTFNETYYKAYSKGFLEAIGTSLTEKEIEYLPLGAKTIIFIMGLRFLTDYLNEDTYYKIKYPEHNLVRAKNQFKLLLELNKFLKKQDLV